ncbi:MAG: GTP-binding protein [Thermomicrobiales bacterium]
MFDQELSAIPFFLVVGRETANRRAVDLALRSMVPGLTVETVAGNSAALEQALDTIIAQDEAEFIVVDMPAQADPGAFFDAVSPYVEDDVLTLTAMIAVVDATRFWTEFRNGGPDVAQMLVGIVESASLVVLANTDADDAESVEGFIRALNQLGTVFSLQRLQGMTLDALVASMFHEAEDDALEAAVPAADASMVLPASEKGGFTSFTWNTNARLDRDRFLALFEEEWPESVLRVKGRVRLPDGVTASVSVIRNAVDLDEYTDEEAEMADAEMDEAMREAFEEEGLPWEDEEEALAMYEDGTLLVFVGRDMPLDDLSARLEACKLPE